MLDAVADPSWGDECKVAVVIPLATNPPTLLFMLLVATEGSRMLPGCCMVVTRC